MINMSDYKKRIFEINSNDEFEKFCMIAFDYQMQYNPVYKLYSDHILKKQTPKNIYQIPFLPIEFFKSKKIICKSKNEEIKFLSSGTQGTQSKHYVADINLYQKSFEKSFEKFYSNIDDYCFLALLPTYNENKNSSLIYMINHFINKTKNSGSGFYISNYDELDHVVAKVEKLNRKIILFGVTYALLDFAKNYKRKLKNTIVMETGGMKGTRKELLKEEVHQILKSSFSINSIHSEYGMTELLSQAYSYGDNNFNTPNWMKVIIRDVNDPFTFIENKTGGINIIDLANIYSCPFIATQDLGKNNQDNSFSLLGRFSEADVRGCNLLIQ